MKKFADILKFLHLSILAAVFCCAGIGEAWGNNIGYVDPGAANYLRNSGGEIKRRSDITDDYYADKSALEIDPEIRALLEKVKDEKDVLTPLEKLASFTGREGANKFGETWLTDSKATDMLQRIQRRLNKLSKNGHISFEQNEKVMNYARNVLYATGSKRAIEAAQQAGNDGRVERIQNANQFVATELDKCPTVDNIRAKYYAGCWSCLVVEKLSSAFLTAASKAYSLSQKAGLILLGLGSILWLLLWGLRNVSSLTQLEPGNILNELIKFGFKVALAYFFIILGLRMVGTYFINPIMGVGARIAESYWDPEKIKPYTEEYVWEDEVVTAEENQEIDKAFAESQQPEDANKKEEPKTVETPVEALKLPEIAQANDPYEEVVQDFQKALVQLLNQRLQTLKGSCKDPTYSSGGQCKTKNPSCRHSPCPDSGHHAAVAQIFADAGSAGTYGAYCQVTVTAALEQLNKMVGGNITNFQPGVMNCRDGMSKAAQYKNASITSPSGGDILLKDALPYANIGDTVYIRVSGAAAKNVGSASGYHATTYIGGGQVISFNGDGKYSVLSAFGANAVGKIVHINEIIRQRLKANPNAMKNINRKELSRLAQGSGLMTLVNYSGGTFATSNGNSFGSAITSIPNVKYSGPTDIMSEAVMNSIIGATKAITDITSENMILGDAIMCYATMDKGGAWHPISGLVVTNFWMWVEGAFYWFTGMLLTLAIAYYLLDMSFKIGFAVVALPIVVGLWPFDLTKDKFGVCISIIAKAAATYAFLAITTTFTVQLTDAVFSYETDESETAATAENEAGGPKGLAKLYSVFDRSTLSERGAIQRTETQEKEDIEYASNKLAVFSTTFVLVLFAFLYSYKLIQKTVPDLVNKFFPDKAFGNSSPMHHWATAASKWVKDQAMKPAKLAADIAMYQGGGMLKGAVGKGVGKIKSTVNGGKEGNNKGTVGKAGGAAGKTMQAGGKGVEMAGEGVQAAGKGVQAAGKGIAAVSQSANVIPYAGQAIAAAGKAAGQTVETAGKAIETVGKTMKKLGKTMSKMGKKVEQVSEKVDNVTKGAENVVKGAAASAADGGQNQKKDDEDKDGGGK